MTEKEIKRLTRPELLEELFKYANANADLQLHIDNHQEEMRALRSRMQAEIDSAQKQIKRLKKELGDIQLQNVGGSRKSAKKDIEIEDAGNIAEATLAITGIFETAQQTADLYVSKVREMTRKQEKALQDMKEKSRLDIQKLGDEATKTCIAMRKQTEQECKQLKEQTEQECDRMRKEAIMQAEAYWESLSVRLEDFYNAHMGMKEFFAGTGISIPKFRLKDKE